MRVTMARVADQVIDLYTALVFMPGTMLQVPWMPPSRTVFFADSPVIMESVPSVLHLLSMFLDAADARKCRPYHRALVLEMACTMAHDSCGPCLICMLTRTPLKIFYINYTTNLNYGRSSNYDAKEASCLLAVHILHCRTPCWSRKNARWCLMRRTR